MSAVVKKVNLPSAESAEGGCGREERYYEALKAFKIAYWTRMLLHTSGNVTNAARIAGVCRQVAHKLILQLGVRSPRRKQRGNWHGLSNDEPSNSSEGTM